MTIKEITDILESIAPLHLQESYDNAGLIVGNHSTEVSGILVCLDSTEAIVEEARQSGCNMIVAHHPIIFGGLKKLNGYHYVERTIIAAIKYDIAIYAIHTNLDNVLYQGVNERIGKLLGLKDQRILSPREDGNTGSGLLGNLVEPMPSSSFLSHLASSLQLSYVKHTKLVHNSIETVALCGGSGRFLLSSAIKQGAQVFISADFKYHEYFEANNEIIVMDIGHYESERFTINLIQEILQERTDLSIQTTEIDTNPVQMTTFAAK